MSNVEFILKKTHPKYSVNIRKWFTRIRNRHYCSVVLFDLHNNGYPQMWFASTDWGNEKNPEFAGVRVVEVASRGLAAKTCFPVPQKGRWTDITEEFWNKYRDNGKLSFPEIWHIEIPETKTHKEFSTI